MSVVIKNSLLVSAVIDEAPGAKVQIEFQDQPTLAINKGRIIYGVACYTADQLAFDLDGNAVIAATDAKNAVLYLVNGDNTEEIQALPLTDMISSLNDGNYRLFDDIKIDWEQSFVRMVAAGGMSEGEAFVFTFLYR